MNAIVGIGLAVMFFGMALFLMGLCAAAAGSIPAPEQKGGNHHFRRHRYETLSCKILYLDRFDRRRWIAPSLVRHHRRQVDFGLAGNRFRQRRRILAHETMSNPFPHHRSLRTYER